VNQEDFHGVQDISINYTSSRELHDRKNIVVNSCFSSIIADNLLSDPDPKSMAECQQRSDWTRWKEAINSELSSLAKRQVFNSVIPTPPKIHLIGFKWVFTRKRNENNEVVKYKARIVTQGFTQT
jgi:GTP cyclohydrolase FolE2